MSLHTGIRPSTSSSARLSVSDSSVLSQQQSHKPLSFRTIPSGRRPLTRTDSDASISSSHHKPSTLRLSRTPSTRSNSNSSVSSNRRMPTTQAPLRPSLSSPNIPFQISLNLVMKVQPIDEKYSMEPIGLRLNDVNILPPKTVRQQPFQQRQRSFSQQPLRGSIISNASDLEDSVFLPDKSPAIEIVVAKDIVMGDDAVKLNENFVQQQLQQNNVANNELKLADARTPQDLKNDLNKTPPSRYKNKQSLLKFSSTNKPRNRNSVSFSETLPRRLNFDECVESENADVGVDVEPLNKTINPNVSLEFSDCSPQNVSACNVNVVQPSTPNEIIQIFNHQKQFRIGFIANNVPMAVNVVLNIRSDEEILYLEPVELSYEGKKVWRISAHQISKEIEAKIEADKMKKNLSTSFASPASNSSFVTAPNGPTPKIDKYLTPMALSSLSNLPQRTTSSTSVTSNSSVKRGQEKAGAKKVPAWSNWWNRSRRSRG